MSIAAVPNGSIEKTRPLWDGSLIIERKTDDILSLEVDGSIQKNTITGKIETTKQSAV